MPNLINKIADSIVQNLGQEEWFEPNDKKGEIGSAEASSIGLYCKHLVAKTDKALSVLAKWLVYIKKHQFWKKMKLVEDGEEITFQTQEEFIAYLRNQQTVVGQMNLL